MNNACHITLFEFVYVTIDLQSKQNNISVESCQIDI